MMRRVSYMGSVSQAVQVISAIVPGSAFAIAMLHCVLLYPCDYIVHRWPTLRLAKYVDDLSVAVQDTS
eukprot:8115835-Karenia_brevis.AAC.1